MSLRFAFLLLVLFGSLSFAHADLVLTGSVYTSNGFPNGTDVCSNGGVTSGSTSASLSLVCSGDNPPKTATLNATVDAFFGHIALDTEVHGSQLTGSDGYAHAQAEFNLDGTYLVSGGVGPTTVTIAVQNVSLGSSVPTCTFTFNGDSQNCDPGGLFVEDVLYGDTVSLQIQMNVSDLALSDFGNSAFWEYGIYSETGTVSVLTPEPSTFFLLVPGIAGVICLSSRRVASRARGPYQA